MEQILVCNECHKHCNRDAEHLIGDACKLGLSYEDECSGTLQLRGRGERTHRTARFFNTGGIQTAIVASFTEGIDWAAYMGGTYQANKQAETEAAVLDHGAKLLEDDARYFFPDIQLPYRE